ncbi:proline/glycine betaine ABC transporter ATP-binding protein [Virgisporangium aliadipatigenens]|uniref:ABC-type quaternary amine transporter n=1 Tax=Virgisporangium aliadipatigenens TaxID=741659 RepID=A0A8J3YY49_9ACTN|nr:betaine/proline/choline family ABC transporter ATP-binding protein [Virgisporangium aliadipatigenens]GIJ51831.1 proline/glycine betaine ABC transporter ATP-binding protein [Virgisporangium aliadipatigenens]
MDGTRKAAPIALQRVRKQYPDGTVAVGELSLELAAGETTVLIGPSGCGKSTVLRMINRLIEPTSGAVLIDGEDVTKSDPDRLRRGIGYVIQHVGLFPHQNVRTNVGTVPRLLGWPAARIRERSDELLTLVGLDAARYGDRYPHELSGGQRQRVGVARALAADPAVLLMDEPFSAVDPIVRTRLQDEFRRLQRTVRKTVVLVTHDIDEAVRLGDRIAVLSEGGKLEQFATPAELLAAPANDFVREFVGGDRGIKRLAVTPIPRSRLTPAVDGDAPVVAADATLQDALAAMLREGRDRVAVRDDSELLGELAAADIVAALAEDLPPAPQPAAS